MRITASQANELVVTSLVIDPVRTSATSHERLIMPFEDDEMNLAMCLLLIERIGGHLQVEQKDSMALLTMSVPAANPLEDKNSWVPDERTTSTADFKNFLFCDHDIMDE